MIFYVPSMNMRSLFRKEQRNRRPDFFLIENKLKVKKAPGEVVRATTSILGFLPAHSHLHGVK